MKADPAVREEIKLFSTGTGNPEVCFQCGNCTAVCPLSKDDNVFPRKTIRNIQLGLKDRLMESSEPWLCYYCGDCSATCPRDANPGELMMGARRYLTSRYDWTGLSRRLYLSPAWELGALAVVASGVFLAFYLGGAFGRMGGAHVSGNTFAPVAGVHYGDWALAGILSFLLLTNAWRMAGFLLRKDKELEISLSDWTGRLKEFILHFFTQKRWATCGEGGTNLRWVKHLLLVSGYLTMMLLVIVLLPWFQRDGMEWHWTALPGYFATGVLLFYTTDAILGRLRKEEQLHKWTHETDWGFLILLFFTALTGILMHLSRLLDLPRPTYYMYVIHLMVAVPMLVVEVPFGKWAHLMYRPLAVYIESVKESARSRAAAEAAAAEPSSAA
jgi:ferredoxin